MQTHLIFNIFMFICQKRKTNAKEIAEVFEISTRSVYRYINALSFAQIPIWTKNGKNGGIFIDENFKMTDIYFTNLEREILKQIIPNSKWVKIDYEEKGEYYVVGLLYENNKIKYVCYGVPSTHSEEPPTELKGFAGWLPIDASKEQGFGYWITYQDAESGETVKLNYELI